MLVAAAYGGVTANQPARALSGEQRCRRLSWQRTLGLCRLGCLRARVQTMTAALLLLLLLPIFSFFISALLRMQCRHRLHLHEGTLRHRWLLLSARRASE
jgi:hypothetical protein